MPSTLERRDPLFELRDPIDDDLETIEPAVSVIQGAALSLHEEESPVMSNVVGRVLFFTLNREDFSFVIHLDRQPRTSRRREAQTGSRARSGSRSERTLDAVEHSRTLMEWWPFLIFHRGGLRIKVINNRRVVGASRAVPSVPTSVRHFAP